MRNRLPALAFLLAMALLPFGVHGEPSPAPKRVLVLYSYNRLVPGNVELDRGLRAALGTVDGTAPPTYSEFLDSPEFKGSAYEAMMVAYLHGKYAAEPPSVIVVVSDAALHFITNHRSALFPGVPVIHAAVAPAELRAIPNLSADIVGVPLQYDYAGTILQGLKWQPGTHRLVIVTGAGVVDHLREARLRSEVPTVAGKVPVEYWSGLSAAELVGRLHGLKSDSMVFTPGFFQDGDGRIFTPRDAAALVARASSAAVYGPYDTFIGTGVVGGRMPSFEAVGDQAGRIVNALLSGTAPDRLILPKVTPTTLHIDWRQAQRWGIKPASITADTVIHFRKPTLWEAYSTQVLVASGILVLQTLTIIALTVERRRRATAEAENIAMHNEVAHVSRRAVAGELTASIAHEINQPLGAIQTAADAADLMLRSGGDRREDLIRIVTRLRRDSLRASEVIRRLRTLLAKSEPERRPFDAGEALVDVAMMLRTEAQRRGVTLVVPSSPPRVEILGDQTQFQQLLLNLAINAMDAVADLPEERRHVEFSLEVAPGKALINVQDRGTGIAPEHLLRLFDSFFTTKQRGMGLGLSIARSIAESSGGRIWAENVVGGELPFTSRFPPREPRSPPGTQHERPTDHLCRG